MALRLRINPLRRPRPWRLDRRTVAGLGLGVLGLAAAQVGPVAAQMANGGGAVDGAGPKGAQIYCFMRNNGNNHQVSWDAAYAVIKRQSDQLFKTSPEHAAVMITEAVVQNSDSFPDCGRYLGDLFSKPEPVVESAPVSIPSGTRSDRYNRY